MSGTWTRARRRPRKPCPARRLARAVALLSAVLAIGALNVPAAHAHGHAAGYYGVKAVAVAASKRGAPYAYGATGPDRFDCSGLTLYSFRKAGKHLPRTAAQQYRRSRPVHGDRRHLGDLVFFPRGGTVGHVGIYAGHGRIWHAPRPGSRVRLERIWTGNVRYGRPL
ncbi:C40 family peptidase [Streptomyces sp. GC420]|uniref:C40 family peptidase n=1 Tax=Streptomyces sp. GC420 TaxID=2697568 RepID=UPI001414EADB|nr:C40 family peptidase [Streptomyces sp. GC420]NBM16858.1 NlpC/P60 family protein [Streptomyces sp. GC420]